MSPVVANTPVSCSQSICDALFKVKYWVVHKYANNIKSAIVKRALEVLPGTLCYNVCPMYFIFTYACLSIMLAHLCQTIYHPNKNVNSTATA